MKKIFSLLLLLPLIMAGQTQTQNYIKTTVYKVATPVNVDYTDFNISLNSQAILWAIGGGGGSGSGSIAMTNNVLSVNFNVSWSHGIRMRVGVIKQLPVTPALPDMELGPILSSGNPTGYFAKIKDNALFFYSPYYLSGINTNLTATIPGQANVNYSTSFANPFVCHSAGNSLPGGGSVVITNGQLVMNAVGQWYANCDLNTESAICYLMTNTTIANLELGDVTSNFGLPTVYKARIQNNQLKFYATVPIPTEIWHSNLSFTQDFGGGLTAQDKKESITYFNGLGMPIQQIASKQSASGKNIIVHSDYDSFGRSIQDYLPFRSDNSALDFEPAAKASTESFYQNPTLNRTMNPALPNTADPNFEATTTPYAKRVLEMSSFGRITEQAQPGNDWDIALGHTVKYDYQTNIVKEVRKFRVSYQEASDTERSALYSDGFFGASQLYKTVTKDENWTAADGRDKTIQEFKKSDGKTILKRTFNDGLAHDTYYVYDDFDNLAYVVPPLATEAIDAYYNTQAQLNRSYPWTQIVAVDKNLAQEYSKLFEEYKNEYILSEDLYNKYGGQGGFSISVDGNGKLSLSLDINTLKTFRLRTGEIVSLKEEGNFKDAELGRVKGNGYVYMFSIKDNALYVTGQGEMGSFTADFSDTKKLVYNTNYAWPLLVDIDPKEAKSYMELYKDIDNNDVLTALVENGYGASGGINVSIDENDQVSVHVGIISAKALSFKKGIILSLDTARKITDRELITIGDDGYKYFISIKDNSLFIEGDGSFNMLNKAGGTGPNPVDQNVIPLDIVEGLCYEYHYDANNRVVEKRIPGKGWEYMVYDKLDRIAATQDANLRLQNKWLFSKYDVFGRVAYTGVFTYVSAAGNQNIDLRKEMQNYINGNLSHHETRNATGFQNGGVTVNYTDLILPYATANNNFTIFTVNYYDDYGFKPYGALYGIPATVFGAPVKTAVKSLNTGSLVRVLGTNNWIVNLTAYDNKSRPLWLKAVNSYQQTQDVVENLYDFSGKTLETKSTHSKTGAITSLIITDKFTYDHADRLLKHTQAIGSNIELLAFNKYNELGQLVQKKVGGPAPAAAALYDNVSTALQTIDYTYNIRGWLKKINNPDLALGTDLFSFKVNYNTPQLGASPLYNGNISETTWKTSNDNRARNYKYAYDDLNRLVDATYVGNYQIGAFTEKFSEGNIVYDKNGNIKQLERYGLLSNNSTIDFIDKLQYFYQPKSNKLIQVDDAAIDAAGFKNGTNTGNDYLYDINGNMVSDANKGITNIVYNHLNLPDKIVFDNQDPAFSAQPKAIEYVYAADGQKQAKIVKHFVNPNTITTKTEYAGKFVYENNVLQFISNPEGYTTKTGLVYAYVYQYKDHLGNVRLSYSKNAAGNLQIIEEDNYYAFGLKHKGYNSAVLPLGNAVGQKREYNGKEFQDELGLNMSDYGARNYDAALGRWMNIDMLAEQYRRWSPYNYCMNNPIVFIDPDGMYVDTSWIYERNKKGEYVNKARVEAFEAFAKSKQGIKFLSNFAEKGQVIAGHKYETGGKFDKKEIDLKFGSLDKDDFADARTGAAQKGAGLEITIELSGSATKAGPLLEDIGHEAFIHAQMDAEDFYDDKKLNLSTIDKDIIKELEKVNYPKHWRQNAAHHMQEERYKILEKLLVPILKNYYNSKKAQKSDAELKKSVNAYLR